jgi:hypothetical protein
METRKKNTRFEHEKLLVKGEEEKKTKSCGNGNYCHKMKEEKKGEKKEKCFSKWGVGLG